MSCVFCTDATRAGEVVFEDDHAWVILHDDWSVLGHAMVVGRRHVENASDLAEEEWLHLARVWHRAERVLLELTGAERAIVMKLGIATPHLHVHLYPVAASASREEVFTAIDGKTRVPRDTAFVDRVKTALLTEGRD